MVRVTGGASLDVIPSTAKQGEESPRRAGAGQSPPAKTVGAGFKPAPTDTQGKAREFLERLSPGEAGVACVPMRHRRFVIAPAKKDDLAVSLGGEVEQPGLQVLEQHAHSLDRPRIGAETLEGPEQLGRQAASAIAEHLLQDGRQLRLHLQQASAGLD